MITGKQTGNRDLYHIVNNSTQYYQLTDKYINPIKKKKLSNQNVNEFF